MRAVALEPFTEQYNIGEWSSIQPQTTQTTLFSLRRTNKQDSWDRSTAETTGTKNSDKWICDLLCAYM